MAQDVGVGLIGPGFMGRAHSLAWQAVSEVFDLPLTPTRTVLCGRSQPHAEAFANRFGWRDVETDWRKLLERDDVQIVDICTPGDSHSVIAVAALDAGKHVLCEKPLANTVTQAQEMASAARRAAQRGVLTMVGFNYRRVPALAHASRLISHGLLGDIRHVRASYLQDWLVDREFPLTWRLNRERAGSGALGDLGAHVVDIVEHLTHSYVAEVSSLSKTFVSRRPVPAAVSSGLRANSSGGELGDVTVDDAVVVLGRLTNGAIATMEATRVATGRKNALRVEINGESGSIGFDLEAINELQLCEGSLQTSGFRRVLVTEPAHPYLEGWWPPGHVLGWDTTFVNELRDFMTSICAGTSVTPTFEDGLHVQCVLDAIERSHETRAWATVEETAPPRSGKEDPNTSCDR